MLRVNEVLVVEGTYDAIKLSEITDATIFTTNGFRIFKDKDRLNALRRLARRNGCVLLTDSDGAGFVIRRYLTGALPGVTVKQAYIPEIPGKEKRKSAPGKEGLLGVEGMDEEVLKNALIAAGATVSDADPREDEGFLTMSRMYADGLAGRPDSARLREAFLKRANLPLKLTSQRMLRYINFALTEEEYETILEEIK